mmetsp:Transcript_21365/g.51829  ORF Transcript_21365/g.51829 Transcript_21365/m.51829 type:complete len:290 (-) Transcript_21365:24-893(-)
MLVAPQHTVNPQLDVLLPAGEAAMLQELCKIVKKRVLPCGLIRFVVEIAHHRTDAFVRRPGRREFHLCHGLDYPSKLLVKLPVRVQIREPFFQIWALAGALQHRHCGCFLQCLLRCRISNTKKVQRVSVKKIQGTLRQFVGILKSLEGLNPQRINVIAPLNENIVRVRIRDLVFRPHRAIPSLEIDHGLIARDTRLKARWDYPRIDFLGRLRIRWILELVDIRHLTVHCHRVTEGDHFVSSWLIFAPDDGDLHLGNLWRFRRDVGSCGRGALPRPCKSLHHVACLSEAR